MFTSHLSYRAGSLPSAQTESPSPLPSVFPRFSSAVEQHAGYNTNKVRAETTKTQDADDVTFNSTAGGLKNVYYELERLSVALSTINLFPKG